MMSAQLQQTAAAAASATSTSTGNTADSESTTLPPLTNRAKDSNSLFVRSHSDSLVAWQLLDEEAVDRAKRENKLIFLSIGYLASHYCHLTKYEVFSSPRVASLLNQDFIPILVDREERPDIDTIYMSYNQSLSGSGGWPLNIFLTPELQPVFSGTYWAAPGTGGSMVNGNDGIDKPLDWITVIEKVLTSWTEEETRVRDEAHNMVVELGHFSGEGTLNHAAGDWLPSNAPPSDRVETPLNPDYSEVHGEVDLDQIEEAYTRITRTFDPVFGGFGQEDKFLTPSKLSLLLRATRFPQVVQDVVGPNDCTYISAMGLHTLRRIASGAVHDHIGGGFHRYSITRDWSLPSFEKMLTDNALLLGVYIDSWLLAGGRINGEFAGLVAEIGDYITSRTLLSENGGFFTSEAAYSPNKRGDKISRNGAFYLWTRKEFDTAIGDEQEAGAAAAYYDIEDDGNVDPEHDPHDEFLNQNVPRIVKNYAKLSKQFNIPENEVKRRVTSAKEKLRAYRQTERVQPEVDTKIITAYNGMTIAALSRASAAFRYAGPFTDGRDERYVNAAMNAAKFIKKELWDDQHKLLYRMYSADTGRASTTAFSEDYAFLIEGLIELYETTGDESWLEWADDLQHVQISLFYDSPTHTPTTNHARCGAFYSTTSGAPYTLLRIKDAMDTSQPSANSVSVSNLFRLGALLGDKRYTYLAKESINAFGVEMLEHPNLFPGLLCGIPSWKLGGRQWVAVSSPGDSAAIDVKEKTGSFHKAPRSNLFTLRYYDPASPESWLSKRDPNTLAQVADLGPGLYKLVDDGSAAASGRPPYQEVGDRDFREVDPSYTPSTS
ncbi:hypothetical protein F4778DRAFT_271065 [Xylariomycetidae sp. FL2044]|nr:hypothetical protein F4778DRAFT_271065 [Xylariomycetidae sp. FL2044]